MTHDTSFALSRFQNRQGSTAWRVSGYLAGVRIRRNFPTREEAAAERSILEIKALQSTGGGVRGASTFLTDDQLREAEAVFQRMAGAPKPLAFYVDYGLANYRSPDRDKALPEAVDLYLAAKGTERAQGLLSTDQLDHIRRHLTVLQNHFPGVTVAQLSADRLTVHCRRGNACPKTVNNRRGILSTFFKFAFQQDWIAESPIAKVPHHRIAHKRGSAATLTAEQAEKLMRHAEQQEGGAFVPFFALALFAGIRPCIRSGEIAKLKPEQVRLDTGVIHIEPDVSKVRMKRNVTIQPNLAAWLTAYPLDKFSIVPPSFQHPRAKIARDFGLSHDIMRHTFISMHVAKYRSMGEAALQAGNSESIIRKHYLDLKTPAEAAEFFSIMPAGQAAAATAQTLPFPAQGAALAATG
jgi:integrase